MSPRKKSPDSKSATLSVRMRPEQKLEVGARAKKAGMLTSEYMVRAALGELAGTPEPTAVIVAEIPGRITVEELTEPSAARRRCPHGVDCGPLDDYGVAPGEPGTYSAYCRLCDPDNGHIDPTQEQIKLEGARRAGARPAARAMESEVIEPPAVDPVVKEEVAPEVAEAAMPDAESEEAFLKRRTLQLHGQGATKPVARMKAAQEWEER